MVHEMVDESQHSVRSDGAKPNRPVSLQKGDSGWSRAANGSLLSPGGAVITFFVALGIFVISAGTGRFLLGTTADQASNLRVEDDGLTSAAEEAAQLLIEPTSKTWECAESSRPVLKGVDVVSYFSLEQHEAAMYGTEEHESVFGGYKFLFVSAENKALFEAWPMRYVPAWGGFCSWGISREFFWSKFNLGPEGDPNSWVILGGVLYIFRSETPKSYFMGDIQANIELGNAHWNHWWGEDAKPGADNTGSPMDTACFCSVETCTDF